ncbi:hypothetical protein ACFY0F_00780 [Streptomyces sp. NPDC001544]|uniref:hypothetical protein n=1 Tax=Streptomyces sp. NPDC001544 TaxID=3364584 RepID=UPI00367585C8
MSRRCFGRRLLRRSHPLLRHQRRHPGRPQAQHVPLLLSNQRDRSLGDCMSSA